MTINNDSTGSDLSASVSAYKPSTDNETAYISEINSDLHQGKLSLLFLCASSFVLLIVLVLFSGDKTVSAFNDEQAMAVENAKVNVQAVFIQPSYSKQRKVYGLVEAEQKADLGFELSGLIAQTQIAEGQRVTKGQILATLDTERLLAQKKELDAALLRAKADAKLAGLTANRTIELVKKRLEPEQRLDEANAKLEAASALVNEMQARQGSLAVELEKSQLRAPFSGQVVQQYLDAGTVVNAGQPLFSLLGEANLEARVGLPARSPLALNLGDKYSLSYKNTIVPSVLISLSKQRNRATRAVDALFTIDADAAERLYLMPGDVISLSVDVEINKQGAWVPASALSNGVRGLWTLFIIDKSTGEQIIQARSVTVEYMEEQRAFVSGAISQGDLVVVSGLHRLAPNQTVQNVQVINTARN
ncbi:MAG: RND family efflux transporter MFP subunit [Glaciecola sp.]|jgi:RND family efflux transporter MFP subunit